MSDDIAKVAILAIPVILYGKDSIAIKCLNTLLLSGAIYLFLVGGRLFREKAKGEK
ncbi:hypothetical protein EV689_10155 [Avibacterium gallinarum]|uniref:Uncharacterized protein n=2 Tax=Pasteurellaceae TaxID=712 RepID=A0A379AXQ0_AVIGA|nr:hypothetical protein EV689_10155 [Avibacterium gallinarum]SUB26532.1 Uncharacterised protein [Avibacterium gallinarum]